MRVKRGGGDGGHRGLRSIQQALGRDDFARVRIGIGRPDAVRGVTDWVLAPFDAAELPVLDAALAAAVDAVQIWALAGVTAAMNRVNRRPSPPAAAAHAPPGSDTAEPARDRGPRDVGN